MNAPMIKNAVNAKSSSAGSVIVGVQVTNQQPIIVPRVRCRNRNPSFVAAPTVAKHALSQRAWLADVDQFFTVAVGRGTGNIAPPLFTGDVFTDDDLTFAPHVTGPVHDLTMPIHYFMLHQFRATRECLLVL